MKKLVVLIAVVYLLITACSDSSSPSNSFGKIKVLVIDIKNNQPIFGALITTVPASESVRTDSNGIFIFNNLQPGNYTVKAEKLGFSSNSTTVNVLADKTIQAEILMYDDSFNNHLPDKPILKAPGNLSTTKNSTVELNWTCNDQDNDELTYTIYCDNVNPPSKIVASEYADNSLIIDNLKHNTQYYWYVIAKDKYGESPKSTINSFKIDTTKQTDIENLVLNIPFDGSYNDISKSNLTASCSSPSYATGRNGDANGAFAFLSQNTVIVRNSPSISFTNNFSVSFWIKPNPNYGTAMADGYAQIVGRFGSEGTYNSSYSVMINSVGQISFQTYSSSYNNSFISANSPVETNKWTHVCVIYSYSTVSIYYNGVLDKVTSINPPQTSGYDMYIGGRQTYNRYFNGFLDDLKIFNKILTDDEVNSLYNE